MDRLLAALRAAGEGTRLRVLGLLGHGELTVSELTQILGQSQPRVSRHLKLLDEAGLVSRFQEGTWAFYRLCDEGTEGELASVIVERIPDGDAQHARDLERLEEIRKTRLDIANAYFSKNAEDWADVRKLHVDEEQVEAALLRAVASLEIKNLVDVGTGTGRILEIFAAHIEKGIGIDISQDMLSVARSALANKSLSHCQARLGDMYNIPVASGSQDAVVIHQVLHYAIQPDIATREAARILRPGGVLLIVDFAPHDLEELRHDHAHRRLGFGDEEVVGWARTAGLERRSVEHLEGEVLTVTIWQFDKPGKLMRLVGDQIQKDGA
jgi:ubiquinone/menaquinone biosynthesis C-methylase UbiE